MSLAATADLDVAQTEALAGVYDLTDLDEGDLLEPGRPENGEVSADDEEAEAGAPASQLTLQEVAQRAIVAVLGSGLVDQKALAGLHIEVSESAVRVLDGKTLLASVARDGATWQVDAVAADRLCAGLANAELRRDGTMSFALQRFSRVLEPARGANGALEDVSTLFVARVFSAALSLACQDLGARRVAADLAPTVAGLAPAVAAATQAVHPVYGDAERPALRVHVAPKGTPVAVAGMVVGVTRDKVCVMHGKSAVMVALPRAGFSAKQLAALEPGSFAAVEITPEGAALARQLTPKQAVACSAERHGTANPPAQAEAFLRLSRARMDSVLAGTLYVAKSVATVADMRTFRPGAPDLGRPARLAAQIESATVSSSDAALAALLASTNWRSFARTPATRELIEDRLFGASAVAVIREGSETLFLAATFPKEQLVETLAFGQDGQVKGRTSRPLLSPSEGALHAAAMSSLTELCASIAPARARTREVERA